MFVVLCSFFFVCAYIQVLCMCVQIKWTENEIGLSGPTRAQIQWDFVFFLNLISWLCATYTIQCYRLNLFTFVQANLHENSFFFWLFCVNCCTKDVFILVVSLYIVLIENEWHIQLGFWHFCLNVWWRTSWTQLNAVEYCFVCFWKYAIYSMHSQYFQGFV